MSQKCATLWFEPIPARHIHPRESLCGCCCVGERADREGFAVDDLLVGEPLVDVVEVGELVGGGDPCELRVLLQQGLGTPGNGVQGPHVRSALFASHELQHSDHVIHAGDAKRRSDGQDVAQRKFSLWHDGAFPCILGATDDPPWPSVWYGFHTR